MCRTDLHVVDGDLARRAPTIVPGHEVVGRVIEAGPAIETLKPGARVGAAWLAFACGECAYCRGGQENLCPNAEFHGWTRDGGYAERMVADGRFLFALPDGLSDAAFAPLLCAGLIGYRSLRMTGDAHRVGLYGFGAAAHIVAQVALWQGRRVHAFVRPGDEAGDRAGARTRMPLQQARRSPPEELDAAISRACRSPRAHRAARRSAGRDRGLRGDLYERHPFVPL